MKTQIPGIAEANDESELFQKDAGLTGYGAGLAWTPPYWLQEPPLAAASSAPTGANGWFAPYVGRASGGASARVHAGASLAIGDSGRGHEPYV